MINYVNFTEDDIKIVEKVTGYDELKSMKYTRITFCKWIQAACIEGGVNRQHLKIIDKVLKLMQGMVDSK